METQENASNCNKDIHPYNDLNHWPPIKSKVWLKEMYPGSFSGIGKFWDFEHNVNNDKNVQSVMHATPKIALSLQNKLEKELEE